MNLKNLKTIRTLTQWPLAKVELVESNNKTYVLKTIHPDFKDEIYRQQALEQRLSPPLFVAHIQEVATTKDEVSFLMDYIDGQQPSESSTLECIALLHRQTQSLSKSPFFKHYDRNTLMADIAKTRALLPTSLLSLLERDQEYFQEIFDTPWSVVHGDWDDGQLIMKNDKYCVLDFGKSFYGPSILDYGYYFDNIIAPVTSELELNIYKRSQLKKAKIITFIMRLSWHALCREKYINYDYQKEDRELQQAIEDVLAINDLQDQ